VAEVVVAPSTATINRILPVSMPLTAFYDAMGNCSAWTGAR
jgi:hypothetical protein